MSYYKVTKEDGSPLFNKGDKYIAGKIYKSELATDDKEECANGIYFCKLHQLPL